MSDLATPGKDMLAAASFVVAEAETSEDVEEDDVEVGARALP
jgi:hypothetical protein